MTNLKPFFAFMRERESIRLKKEAGEPKPWTEDTILQTYKFTNVKREHDKTTRFFRERFYENPKYKHLPPEVHFLNCIIFRFIGLIETIEEVGYQETLDPDHLRRVLYSRKERGQKVFTSAYMLPAYGVKAPKIEILLDRTLIPFWAEADHLCSIAELTQSWKTLLGEMKHIHGFGGSQFMAKEVLLDTMFTPIWSKGLPHDFNTYCPVGPGAQSGLNRIMGRPFKKSVPYPQLMEEMAAIFKVRKKHLPKDFVELVLHDIQFQLCEFDKYERVRLGEGTPKSRYNGRKD